MFVERVSFSLPKTEGEIIFFTGKQSVPRLPVGTILPNLDVIARINLMESPQIIEFPKAGEEAIETKTQSALLELYHQSMFASGRTSGSCLRLMNKLDQIPDQLPSKTIETIRKQTREELLPVGIEGKVLQTATQYNDINSQLYSLANLRQSTGSLETGDPQVNQKTKDIFHWANGDLFAFNRQGDQHAVLSDVNRALLLADAFPEDKSNIDVADVSYDGGVIPGQAMKLAQDYLQRAMNNQLLVEPFYHPEPIPVNSGIEDLKNFNPPYESRLSEYQYHLGSNALAGITLLDFLAVFDPAYLQTDAAGYAKTVNQAKQDLKVFDKKHPGLFQDPGMVLLFSEHLAKIHQVQAILNQKPASPQLLKSA